MATSQITAKAEVLANRFVALATYRHLLRATRIAFKGDRPVLTAARRHARESFNAGATLENGSAEAAQSIEHAQGVAQILRQNVVQGKNVGGDKYKLNIHEHTERGDNDTAKQLKGTSKSWKEVKDAAF